MNQNTQRQKRIYMFLLIITSVIVVAAVTLSLIFGLSSSDDITDDSTPVTGEVDDPEDDEPDDSDEVVADTTTDTDEEDEEEDSEETSATVVSGYEMPLDSYTLGQLCVLDEMVWSSTLEWYSTHNGVDFLADEGSAVSSVYSGTVTSTGYTTLDGYYVIIAQDDGIITTYKSLTSDIVVDEGDTVKAGSIIGYVGNTMTSEQNEGAHLHLEMTLDGEYIDPLTKLSTDDDK